jgi:hypothetical protein
MNQMMDNQMEIDYQQNGSDHEPLIDTAAIVQVKLRMF